VGSRWARESFDAWVVAPSNSWKAYWFFANVQRAVDMALVSLKTQRTPQAAALLRLGGVSDVSLASAVKQYPYLAYSTNLGASFAALFFGLVFVFAFLTTVVLILKSMVMEKELRIREGMLMMGLRGRTYWLSWFVTHYSTLAVVAMLMALIGIYPVRAHASGTARRITDATHCPCTRSSRTAAASSCGYSTCFGLHRSYSFVTRLQRSSARARSLLLPAASCTF
jgi:hypothetical protein